MNLYQTAVIRNQPTNFVKKAKISNLMSKETNKQTNECVKRANVLLSNPYGTSLNIYNPAKESENETHFNPTNNLIDSNLLPNSNFNSQYTFSDRNQTNTQVFWGDQTFDLTPPQANTSHNISNFEKKRPRAKYSLFKRNDE